MHSFQPSRGRIFFEVLCALGVSASLAGAWMQTGATALLPAAAVSALFALVHATRMKGRAPAVVVEPQQQFAVAEDVPGDLPVELDTFEPSIELHEEAAFDEPVENAELVDPEPAEELIHAPVERLFEPEPFGLHQRAVFGRKTEHSAQPALAQAVAAKPRKPRRKKDQQVAGSLSN